MTGFRYYWEDFPVGRVFEHGSRTLSEREIIAFARDWDPQRYHVDPQAAKDTPYRGLIASGWHTGCLMMRFISRLNNATDTAEAGNPLWRITSSMLVCSWLSVS